MDNVVRKRAGVLICIIILMITLCSCSIVSNFNDFVSQEQEIKTIAQQVMQCIVNKNKTELLTLYSSDQINNHEQEIYSQFDSAFKFISGKIVSYEYAGKGGGGATTHYGKTTYFHCYPEFRNVITDTGFEYVIEISFHYIWEEKPEREGVTRIKIIDAENYKNYVEIGFEYLDD